MNESIPYTTVEQQIQKLKDQNLIIEDEKRAKHQLQAFGYSGLIKSYRDPYIISDEHGKTYRTGTTFDRIASLHLLDQNLRNAVIASMLALEEHIKAVSADVIASSFGTHQDQYLSFRNYRDKKKRKEQFTLPHILNQMRETLSTTKDPIAHYRTEHGIVPPWILFKSVYFSTIINFIDLFKPQEQAKMLSQLYNPKAQFDKSTSNLLMDTLFTCLEYRNLAAHGGRIYNYNSKRPIRFIHFLREDHSEPKGFFRLLVLLQILKYKTPYLSLSEALNEQVNRHCSLFPEDVTYLGQILNVNIEPVHVVWITDKSNKYHTDPHCSGIKEARQINFNDILDQGYIPCKKCVPLS